ncbi:MAG TPA: OmpA family protein [Chthoniobacterales bacterium]
MAYSAYSYSRSSRAARPQPTAGPDWAFRRWLFPMLFLSLLIHAGIVLFFQFKRLNSFVPIQEERLVQRPFQLSRAQIDPKVLQQSEVPAPATIATKPLADIANVQLPDPKQSFEEAMKEIRATPATADLSKPLQNEKPKVDPANINAAFTKMEERSAQALDNEMEKLRKELTAEKPESLNQPALRAQGLTDSSTDSRSDANTKKLGDTAGPDSAVPGFSSLDQLITQTGPLKPGTAPILMPTDLLFDYDSYNLRPGAVTSLQALGRLIQKNPAASFVIEGHTDSFGSDDYNVTLSQERADAVKVWLVQSMGINATRIQTRGFGKSRLLVPGSKSIEEQQLNRRVEIVIKTK